MDTKKKKNKYKGVISPPIKDEFLRGYGLGRALPRGLKKEPVMQTEAIMSKSTASVKPSKPRYGAGGTDNPRKPRYGAGGTNNPKVKKKKPKTAKQRLYEAQIKARRERQKKDPLGRD